MNPIRGWAVALTVGCLLCACSTTSPASSGEESAASARDITATEVATVEGITEYRLPNGLRFLLFPDQSKQQITVNITYLVGSRHEGYGETGMAHLLEHLVFKGSTDHPNIDNELSERGSFANGTTWFDRTNYYETFPANEDNLDWALDLESDRMVNSFIKGEDLESEMTVVRNEWEAGENDPGSVLMERVMSTAYLWHNYGNSTIGARADIENVPLDRLQAFYRKYYQPDNAVLVVAGRFDHERAVAMIEEKFGTIAQPGRTGANQLFETYTAEPAQDGERTVTLRRVGDVQFAIAAYHVPAGSDEKFAAIDVLAHLMSNQPAGRLYKNLVEPGLAASAAAFAFQLGEPGLLLAQAQVRKDDDLDRAAQVMLATLHGVIETPPTEEEVNRAKTQYTADFDLGFNNPQSIALQLSEWAAMGDWRLLFLHRDRVAQVTPDDVLAVADGLSIAFKPNPGLLLPNSRDATARRSTGQAGCGGPGCRLHGPACVGRRRSVRADAGEHRTPHDQADPRQWHRGRAVAEAEPRRRGELRVHIPAWNGGRVGRQVDAGKLRRFDADPRNDGTVVQGDRRRNQSLEDPRQPIGRCGIRGRYRQHRARKPARGLTAVGGTDASAGVRSGRV